MDFEVQVIMMKWTKPFKQSGSLYRWKVFQFQGKNWKEKHYFHRKANKWISTGQISVFRGRVN